MATSDYDTQIDIAVLMVGIFATCLAGLFVLILVQKKPSNTEMTTSSFLPDETTHPSKRFYEIFVARYSIVWMGAFVVIVVTQAYERFSPVMYILVLGALCAPFLLQPLVYPGPTDQIRPWTARYSFKANLWLAVYSYIGNYWYTHYFYSVLQASYTMPNAIRLNNVPICMFLATHFYFSSYHMFSNCLLRKVLTSFERTIQRDMLFVSVIGVLAYFTAFMETFTISAFPYWEFADRNMAYAVGSAFYGIYFIVSFPAFFFFDNAIDNVAYGKSIAAVGVWETIVQSCGYGMMILTILDWVRLYLEVPLVVGASVAATIQ